MSKPVESLVSAPGSRHAAQRSRALCGRYVFAEFRTLHLPVRDGDAVRCAPWRWALGLFRRDQYEVLGAWPAQDSPALVVHDLHERGIEHLRAVAGIGVADCISRYPDAVSWPSDCEPGGTSSPAVGGFGPRRRAALESAIAVAERLQQRMARAIKRHGPFSNDLAAADFLRESLEKADRRFQVVRTVGVGRRAPGDARPRSAAADCGA